MTSAARFVVPGSVLLAFLLAFFFFDALILGLVLFITLYVFFYSGTYRLKNHVSSVEVGSRSENSTRPRRALQAEKGLISRPFDDVATLYDVFQHGLKVAKTKPCFGTRVIKPDGTAGDFEWQTFEQVQERILNVGSGLLQLGVQPKDRIGLYSENRAEWMITSEACNHYSFVSVAIYDTLGEENRVYIVDQAEIVTIVTKRDHLSKVLSLKSSCEHLKFIILYEEVTNEEEKQAEEAGLKLLSFSQLEKLGSSNRHEPILPKPDDLATIMYTSGTTSRPKGVLISHANVVATCAGVKNCILPITPDDVYLSYLPLAHILERVSEAVMLCHGCRIGFWQGNIRKLDDDIKTLKPTIFAGVPKVYQRVMNGVLAKVKAGGLVKRIVFHTAFSLKRLCLQHGIPVGPLDKLFAPIREALGGRVKQMVAGGAPWSGECHEFIRVCFAPSAAVLQGYGLTETCGGATITPVDMVEPYNRQGTPLWCCEIKLVDAGNYSTLNDPPQGEVCVSGANVTLGYYKMPEQTAEVFRMEDGKIWFHTGDVGQWNPDGSLTIIGRTKDIFKLDGGEYVAPERLETIYLQSPFVNNVFVYGESTKAYLIAVVVPEQGAALAWAKENNVPVPDMPPQGSLDCPPSLCENEKFKAAILKSLRDVAATAKLNRFEWIMGVHLSPTVWLPQGGLVTDALKNKRPVLSKHFGKQLAKLYEEIDAKGGPQYS